MPMSIVVSNLLKFGIQIFIFICFYLYYYLTGHNVSPNLYLIYFPLLIIAMGMLGLGLGMIISSMVTKYRDLTFLVSFGVQLLMYLSAVMYPLDLMREKLINIEEGYNYAWVVDINPIAHLVEFGRFMLLNDGSFSVFGIIYTTIFTIVVFLLGLLIFNKTEKTFIDTI